MQLHKRDLCHHHLTNSIINNAPKGINLQQRQCWPKNIFDGGGVSPEDKKS